MANPIVVELHKGFKIEMRGFNQFECKALKLYGYSTVRQLKNAIDKTGMAEG